jgi:hypothetical protein
VSSVLSREPISASWRGSSRRGMVVAVFLN